MKTVAPKPATEVVQASALSASPKPCYYVRVFSGRVSGTTPDQIDPLWWPLTGAAERRKTTWKCHPVVCINMQINVTVLAHRLSLRLYLKHEQVCYILYININVIN